jgi:hypothetical protein
LWFKVFDLWGQSFDDVRRMQSKRSTAKRAADTPTPRTVPRRRVEQVAQLVGEHAALFGHPCAAVCYVLRYAAYF